MIDLQIEIKIELGWRLKQTEFQIERNGVGDKGKQGWTSGQITLQIETSKTPEGRSATFTAEGLVRFPIFPLFFLFFS